MKIYRGDSIGKSPAKGHTFVDSFLSNGLMAKFSDGGSSKLIQGKDLVDLVLSHVGYEKNQPEQDLSYRSPLLSFTENIQVAMNFISPKSKKKLQECLFGEASHFIWELSFDLENEIQCGVYKLLFKSDSINVKNMSVDQLHRALIHEQKTEDLDGFGLAAMNYLVAMNYCCSHQKSIENNQAIIIDVVKFIQSCDLESKNTDIIKNTIFRAGRDKEWLLYPCTPMPDGYGLSGNFPLTKHLSVYKSFCIC